MDELLPSLHYEATKATLPEQNQLALFKLAHYRESGGDRMKNPADSTMAGAPFFCEGRADG
jgi:hypothetical protein